MALKKGQQRALQTLQERQQAGTIKAGGLARLNQLQAQQGGGGGGVGAGNPQRHLNRVKIDKPKTVIKGQGKENQYAANQNFQLNNAATETDQYGNQQTITRNPDGSVNINRELSPEQQQIQNYETGVRTNIYKQAAGGEGAFSPLNFSELPAAPNTQDLAGERQRIEQGLYGGLTQGFGEEKARERDALAQNLAERGIQPGSGTLYENEMNRFEKSWNDRYDAARSQSIAQGGSEFDRSFSQGRLGRADALSEQVMGRQFPLQQAAGLFSLGGANPGQFNAFRGSQYNPVDVGGISTSYHGINKQAATAANQLALQQQQLELQKQQLAQQNQVPGVPPPPPSF